MPPKNVDEELLAIARKHLHLSTLTPRQRDSLDFSEHHVTSIRDALRAAYDLGRTHHNVETK